MAQPRDMAANDPLSLEAMLQEWAEGRATLRDVRGYSDEELFSISRIAYTYFHQGRLSEARTLFQGLFAVDPTSAYFARAMGVVELASGSVAGALASFDLAVKLAPDQPEGYVARAEVKISQGRVAEGVQDLRLAARTMPSGHLLESKVLYLLEDLS